MKSNHEKDVEVVSVSLDDNKEAWEKAYKEENIPWIDGSNLLGWKDPVALWYAIRGIPAQGAGGPARDYRR